MKEHITMQNLTSRRSFLARATTLTAFTIVSPRLWAADDAAAKPNSVCNGVRIGCISYSYRGGSINTAAETLKALLEDGLSEVELMDGPICSYAGIRVGGGRGRKSGPAETPPKAHRRRAGGTVGQMPRTPENV